MRSITVTFSRTVTFAGGNGNAAAAFQLEHLTDGNMVALAAAVATDGQGRTTVTLSFSGPETDPVSAENGGQASLADGRYSLKILSGSVMGTTNGLALDGDADGVAGGDYVSPTDTLSGGPGQLGLYRLFGDATGNGIVDQVDLGQFRSTNNASAGNPAFITFLDADNSGTIDQFDLGQFRQRNNSSVFPTGPIVTPGGGGHQDVTAPLPAAGPTPFAVPVSLPTPIAAPPTVASVAANDGNAQRLEVRPITVAFSGPITFSGGYANAAAAPQLKHPTEGHNVALAAAVAADRQGRTVVTLTFSGGETDPLSGENGGIASLADGRSQLTILRSSVAGTNGLAGNGGGPNGNHVSPADTLGDGPGQLHLYRLFGDATGDGIIDQADPGRFRSILNTSIGDPLYLSFLDADNSGVVDLVDLGEFRARNNIFVF